MTSERYGYILADINDETNSVELARQDASGTWRVADDVQSRLSSFFANCEDVEATEMEIVPLEVEAAD